MRCSPLRSASPELQCRRKRRMESIIFSDVCRQPASQLASRAGIRACAAWRERVNRRRIPCRTCLVSLREHITAADTSSNALSTSTLSRVLFDPSIEWLCFLFCCSRVVAIHRTFILLRLPRRTSIAVPREVEDDGPAGSTLRGRVGARLVRWSVGPVDGHRTGR